MPKYDLDRAHGLLQDAMRAVNAAQIELRKQGCTETADELTRIKNMIEFYVKPQGMLWHLENSEEWPEEEIDR